MSVSVESWLFSNEKCQLSSSDTGESSVTRVIHAKRVWVPIHLVLSRNMAKGTIRTSPSQWRTTPNEPFL